MSKKITCFLPCRQGSERVPRKNIKPFSGYEKGLIQIKLGQLCASGMIDEIVLSTNDTDIIEYAISLGTDKLRVHKRVEELSSSSTSTDQLVAHAASLVNEGHILWTHVTSPFITAAHYDQIIGLYFKKLMEGYDSLMTITEIQGFLWKNGKPMNYDRSIEKWPRTQTIDIIQEINSGAFLAPLTVYCEQDDRIGQIPYLYALDKLVSYDIDWPEDFVIAECMAEKGLVKI